MSKQVVEIFTGVDWRKWVAVFVLAAALVALPMLAEHLPGPLGSLFVQHAYACPVGGTCG